MSSGCWHLAGPQRPISVERGEAEWKWEARKIGWIPGRGGDNEIASSLHSRRGGCVSLATAPGRPVNIPLCTEHPQHPSRASLATTRQIRWHQKMLICPCDWRFFRDSSRFFCHDEWKVKGHLTLYHCHNNFYDQVDLFYLPLICHFERKEIENWNRAMKSQWAQGRGFVSLAVIGHPTFRTFFPNNNSSWPRCLSLFQNSILWTLLKKSSAIQWACCHCSNLINSLLNWRF